MCQQRDTYKNVYSTFMRTSQKLKTMQTSDEQMNNLWYILFNAILLSNKKGIIY